MDLDAKGRSGRVACSVLLGCAEHTEVPELCVAMSRQDNCPFHQFKLRQKGEALGQLADQHPLRPGSVAARSRDP